MKIEIDQKDILLIPDARIAILQSKWYREYVDNMVSACISVLKRAQCLPPEHHILPGSLELPLAAQTLIRSAQRNARYDALICFGSIMKGETHHFDMIMNECARGLGAVMLAEDTPIIVEVLPVASMEQLIARTSNDKFNKGIEAAIAAAEVIHWRRSIKNQHD